MTDTIIEAPIHAGDEGPAAIHAEGLVQFFWRDVVLNAPPGMRHVAISSRHVEVSYHENVRDDAHTFLNHLTSLTDDLSVVVTSRDNRGPTQHTWRHRVHLRRRNVRIHMNASGEVTIHARFRIERK